MINTVILDFDDTLYMSELACFELETEVLAAMGREPMERDIHLSTWGMQLSEAIQLRSPGIDVDAFWNLLGIKQQEFVREGRIDAISDERLEALDQLVNDMQMRLFILTSRTEQEVSHLLDEKHSLARRVERIYHADNTTHIKPDPRVFDVLLAENHISPKDCVYVGDSPSDAVAAKGAGLKFIASYESGLRSERDFSKAMPDGAILHFTDLPRAIRKLS